MVGIPINITQRIPAWFIILSKWLWKKQSFIWSAIILNIILGVVVTLLFTPRPWSTSFRETPIGWAFQHSLFCLILGLCLLSFTCITYLGSRLSTTATDKVYRRRYLNRMMRETEMLTLKGIPAGLIAESVQLDEVFIPLQLRLNRPLTDYPLTEEELSDYRTRLESNMLSRELERVLFDAEKNWQSLQGKSERISLSGLWQRLTKERPTAVIQGFPGMGKSTLLARLTLHMARCGLGQSDAMLPEHLAPLLIPILCSLADYATERARVSTLSLTDYLKLIWDRLNIPGVTPFLQRCLQTGHCLVLLDGLDEVSDQGMRRGVQQAIKSFILENRDVPPGASNFNRFLITSRVAGYDQAAFPEYQHYTIAELTTEQIDDFLPRWCRANVRRDRAFATNSQSQQEEAIALEAAQRAKELSMAIKDHQGVRDLAENPLLLTLLAVLQQNSIELPRQRVELFSTVTRMLLESRDIAKGLAPIPELQAVQRLGPLALQMQEAGNSIAHHNEVMTSLIHTISSTEGSTTAAAKQEATIFLTRIRERGGLFVKRTGDYYGFLHRSFQEYFAARQMLIEIENDRARGISELVNKAYQRDDLWREPFLLAVVYISRDDAAVASQIIQTFLNSLQVDNTRSREHDLFLAAICLVEVKPLTIDPAIERQIFTEIFLIYEEAQRNRRFIICDQLEVIIKRWLLSLPKEVHRPSLGTALHAVISDSQHIMLQRAVLTLLIMIFEQQASNSSALFPAVIPPLLALAGLSAVGEYRADPDLPKETDQTIATLALSALSLTGQQGPAGLLRQEVLRHFNSHPEHLRLLARYSLESGILLTPAVIPSTEENYQRYTAHILQWLGLRDGQTADRATEESIDLCFKIHRALLDCCEEVRYPSSIHFLNIVTLLQAHPDQTWQQIWQNYLASQLMSSQYTTYLEVILLWMMLSTDPDDKDQLVAHIIEHYGSNGTLVQRNAQHFLASLSQTLLDLRDPQDLRAIQRLPLLRNLLALRDLRDLRDLRHLSNVRHQPDDQNPQAMQKQQDPTSLSISQLILELYEKQQKQRLMKLRDMRNLLSLRELCLLRDVLYLQSQQYLRVRLLTPETAEKAMQKLSRPISSASEDRVEQIDQLMILLGRILQIREANEVGGSLEREVKLLAQTACSRLAATENNEEREAGLTLIRFLPTRSANEIKLIIQLAEETTDQRIQLSCATALKRARPQTSQAWSVLETASLSRVNILHTAVEERLKLEQCGELQ